MAHHSHVCHPCAPFSPPPPIPPAAPHSPGLPHMAWDRFELTMICVSEDVDTQVGNSWKHMGWRYKFGDCQRTVCGRSSDRCQESGRINLGSVSGEIQRLSPGALQHLEMGETNKMEQRRLEMSSQVGGRRIRSVVLSKSKQQTFQNEAVTLSNTLYE